MMLYLLLRADFPWGDYGHVLVDGLSRRRGRVDGTMQFERTGPFVPPLMFPTLSEVVVTDGFRNKMLESGLTGVAFGPVHLATAVPLHWEHWDRTQPLPFTIPSSNEPEDYVRPEEHDSACAEKIGRLWEMQSDNWGIGVRVPVGRRKYAYNVEVRVGAPDVFKVSGFGFFVVNERARAWLSESAPGWARFEPITSN